MKEQSSFRERAKFSRRILRSRQRSLMPNEYPAGSSPPTLLLTGFVLNCLENSLAALCLNQLVCPLPVEIFNHLQVYLQCLFLICLHWP